MKFNDRGSEMKVCTGNEPCVMGGLDPGPKIRKRRALSWLVRTITGCCVRAKGNQRPCKQLRVCCLGFWLRTFHDSILSWLEGCNLLV